MNQSEKNVLEILRSEMMRVDGELSILRDHRWKMKNLLDEADDLINIKSQLKREIIANTNLLLNSKESPESPESPN